MAQIKAKDRTKEIFDFLRIRWLNLRVGMPMEQCGSARCWDQLDLKITSRKCKAHPLCQIVRDFFSENKSQEGSF